MISSYGHGQHHYDNPLPEFLHLAGVRVLALPGGGVEILLEGVQPDPVPVDGPQAAARLLSLQAATTAESAASEPATSSKSAATTKSSVAVSIPTSTKAPISISVSSVSRHPEHNKRVLTLAQHTTPNSISAKKKTIRSDDSIRAYLVVTTSLLAPMRY